MLAAYFAFL